MNKMISVIFLIILGFADFNGVHSENMRFEGLKINVTTPEYLAVTGEVRKISRTVPVINVNITLSKELENVMVHVKVFIYKNNKFIPTVLNTTYDLCNYFKFPPGYLLLNFIYQILEKGGDMPGECPVQPGFYYLRNLVVPRTKYFPDGRFRLDVIVYGDDIAIANFNIILVQEQNLRNYKSG